MGMGLYLRGQRWYIRWKEGGRLHAKSLGPSIKTEAQARAVLKTWDRKRMQGKLGLLDPSRITLEQFKEQFLIERHGHIAESTLERYSFALQAIINLEGSGLLLRSLTASRISKWASLRLTSGIKPISVNTDLRHIKAALRWAAKRGFLESAPEIEMVRQPKRLPRHLTPAEMDRFFDAEPDPLRRRLWMFALWTGLRREELLGFQWQNIIWGARPTARIIGKGDKERLVPLLPKAVEALGDIKDIGPVWPQVHPATLSKWFKRTAKEAGLSAHLHDTRHTCFTYLLSKGVKLKVVQTIAGHSDIRITQEYTKAFVGDLYDEMSKVLY